MGGIFTLFFIYYCIQFDKIIYFVVFKRKYKNKNILYIIFSNLLYPFYDFLVRMTFGGKEADHFSDHKNLLIRVKGKIETPSHTLKGLNFSIWVHKCLPDISCIPCGLIYILTNQYTMISMELNDFDLKTKQWKELSCKIKK